MISARYCAALGLLAALFLPDARAGSTGSALERPAPASLIAPAVWTVAATRAGDRLVVVGERGIVLLSDDAGRHWRQARVPVSVSLTAVRFIDARRGFAVGHGGVVLSTEDGGENWHKRFDGVQAAALMLVQARARGDAAAIQAAQRLVDDGADKPLFDLYFADALHGIVVGAYNLAFETDDGGATWRPWSARLPNPRGLHLYALRVRGEQVLICGEQGLVMRSTDSGRTFAALRTPYAGSFFAGELTGEQGIVLAGLRGNVWRSADGGSSWGPDKPDQAATVIGMAQRPDGTMLLADQAGQLYAGQVRSNGWKRLQRTPVPMLTGFADLDASRVLLLTAQGPMPWALSAEGAK